jgi:hypothetical protein
LQGEATELHSPGRKTEDREESAGQLMQTVSYACDALPSLLL